MVLFDIDKTTKFFVQKVESEWWGKVIHLLHVSGNIFYKKLHKQEYGEKEYAEHPAVQWEELHFPVFIEYEEPNGCIFCSILRTFRA